MTQIIENIQNLPITPILAVGIITFVGFYIGKTTQFIKLPSIIGFMVVGVLFGPSLFNILNNSMRDSLSFITDIALAFVAISIGLELSFSSLKKQGAGIITVIFTESLLAFALVASLIYLLTRDLPLSLIFGAIAPASAPAGTVAVIQEFRAKGPLTKALYAVVGFDDGLGIIIFGFCAAIARSLLIAESGGETPGFLNLMSAPLLEVFLSLLVGGVIGIILCILARRMSDNRGLFILVFSLVMLSIGLCHMFHLSLILTNMIIGMFIVNTQASSLTHRITNELSQIMPLLFVMFFVLAGANLHISALPALGAVGIVYAVGRSTGLVTGAAIGAFLGKLNTNIRKYIGMGILSQAGVAIGLALIVKKEFSTLGSHGSQIGATVLTTITATCIFFELIGPVLTKIGLEKAGEIQKQ
ncbi:MAG: cation:proton antiporter [Spirochaetes bacterium]|jgi:Kef-type K+ transport system membrane component KefB|nr:cation:proton antiporter [Spirochaetota bacterium]